MQGSVGAVRGRSLPGGTLVVLALLTAVAPFATDMYLTAFPVMARDLHVPASSIQLTLTAFFVGLAVGQLFFGPLSDRYGRRRPLLVGSFVCLGAGVVVATAPTVPVLVAGRVLQGLGGAAGVVLARAVVADRAEGAAVARLFTVMMLIGGVAPVLAPLAGTAVLAAFGWRGILWVLVGLTALMFLGALVAVPESLPPERRAAAGVRTVARSIRSVLGNRAYVGYGLACAWAFAALFAYISASPFVVQNVLGLSAGQYSVVFGVNAVGLSLGGLVSARLVGRVSERRLLLAGLGVLVSASCCLLVDVVVLDSPRRPTLVILFVAVSSLGAVFGNATALAISQVRDAAGSASAFLGASQFALGALVAPLVGLGGDSAFPMALTLLVAGVLAALSAALVASGPRPAGVRAPVGPAADPVGDLVP
ncbi:MAG: transporter, family, multidrug resistance protein [Actinomycetota bacterium]|nr:transporter, family, multidrug resistance protein [Actinomycetota bacterium]